MFGSECEMGIRGFCRTSLLKSCCSRCSRRSFTFWCNHEVSIGIFYLRKESTYEDENRDGNEYQPENHSEGDGCVNQ